MIEEEVLFPALADQAELNGLIAELQAEHVQLKDLVDLLRTRSDRAVLSSFANLLEQHIRKEERVLFEATQRLLSREQLDRLALMIAPPS